MIKYTRRVQYARGVFPQRGSALIIALVFLLIMTLIGTTAMQGTSQQEKMAGNMRDHNLAFQAAEAALREAVNILEVTPTPSIPFQESNDPSVLRDPTTYDWGTARVYSGALTGISVPPRYVVRRLRGVGASSAASADGVYRVTARAQGGTTDAVVVLQKTFQCTESGTSIQCND